MTDTSGWWGGRGGYRSRDIDEVRKKKRLRMIEMERWDEGGATEGMQTETEGGSGGDGERRKDRSEPRRILKQVKTLNYLDRDHNNNTWVANDTPAQFSVVV